MYRGCGVGDARDVDFGGWRATGKIGLCSLSERSVNVTMLAGETGLNTPK